MAGNAYKVALIFALWGAGILAGGQFAKVSVTLPELQTLYPRQADQIAWLLTLVSVVGALLGGVAASLANRLGLRHALIVSLVLAGALSLWQATYPSYALMAFSRLAEGVTHLGIVVTAPALMAEVSSDRWRGATMALWSTFFGVSFALFGWFGIPFVSATGVGGLLQLHGICLLLIAVLVGLLIWGHRASDVPSAAPQSVKRATWVAFQDASVVWSGIAWLFYTLTYLALLTILPVQLSEELRPQITTAMSLIGVASGLLVVPAALMCVRATRLVIAGFLLAILVLAISAWTKPIVLSISLFAILGIIQSGTFAAVAELNDASDRRTLGYGAIAQTGNIGNLIGTPLMLVILEVFDLGTVLATTCVIYGVGVGTLWALARRLRTTYRPPT